MADGGGHHTTPVLPEAFSPTVRRWFAESFEQPTAAQLAAWAAIASGNHTLVVAPTGSGKTLAAFLWALDQLAQRADRPPGTSVVYVSPLKALAVDIERNLRGPLAGIARLDPEARGISVGVRTGDTDPAQRRRLLAHPPDILITTPESLYLMLTSSARDTFTGVTTVIVDEVHAVAGNKRGSHLALSLERLARVAPDAQRIGCSATVRPVETVANFLSGGRPVEVVVAPADKVLDLSVAVPVEDLANPPAVPAGDGTGEDDAPRGAPSVWPHVERAVFDQITAHTSTLVFANSRRLAERLTTRLNELWAEQLDEAEDPVPVPVPGPARPPAAVMAQSGASRGAPPVLARAHHGSVSKEVRRDIEDDLKAGRLRAVVATSSLELGIDMGALDLVVQVQAPPGVSSGLQRVGRAGHQVGAVSRAVVYPTHRGDLLAAAVTIAGMESGDLEPLAPPRHPLDVLAQQIVAMTAVEEWDVDELYGAVRHAWPYRDLPRSAYEGVLDMLAGRYPSDDFASLKPRVVWDRSANTVAARPGAQRIAVTSGGTIPDRGHFGVFLTTADGNTRVGELDEEMVYESRVGDVFALGSSSWRIEDITADRVLVTPAPGQAARLPFWKGDAIGRPAELGLALGEFLDAFDPDQPAVPGHLDPAAAANLAEYLGEQVATTGELPGATRILVEQFRDELGDRRVVLHSPFGARVHAPWALILADRLEQRYQLDAQVMPADDGIVLRLPDDGSLDAMPDLAELVAVDPLDVHRELTRLVGGSALFASRFRECAARALLFPRRDPSRRSPLWQQRQRSAQLLSVASSYDSFPIVLETVRECLQDVYDVPALTALLRRIESGDVRLVEVSTPAPSPFARSLLFGYVASFLYEGDSPLAERKSAALALDDALLTELLGTADLRDLLHDGAIADVDARLQRLGDRAVTSAEQAWDALAQIGPLRIDECSDRGITVPFLAALESARRIFRFRHAGHEWLAVSEDAGRIRDGLGVALPPGLPEALLQPVPTAATDLAVRFARCHGPFPAAELADRYGLPPAVAHHLLDGLVARGTLLGGAFRPGGTTTEYCHPDSLRAIRRASAARYRDEIEPVAQESYARFPGRWQHVGTGGRPPRGRDAVLAAIDQLAGAPLPASQLEHPILASRVGGYEPGLLDELTMTGEVVWWGVSPLPNDGWVALAPADLAPDLLPLSSVPDLPLDLALLTVLRDGGGWFADQLLARVSADHNPSPADVDAALLRLLWSGQVSNDTIAPVRLLSRRSPTRRTAPPRRRARLAGSRTVRGTGRWTALSNADLPHPARSLAVADCLLHRHGLVTRGVAQAERLTFGEVYRALSALEDRGMCRRGYVVDGLGGAQFGLPGAVDLVRAQADAPADGTVVVLAAADPANPYGAGLPWPDPAGPARPGRKAGATVVLLDGRPVVYAEKGGGSLLVWEGPGLDAAAAALVAAVHAGDVAPLAVKKVNSSPAAAHESAQALQEAGGTATPSGVRVRR